MESSVSINPLVKSGKPMRFMALGQDKGEDSILSLALDPEKGEFDNARYSGNFLEARMGSDDPAKRLPKIWQESRNVEVEQSISILLAFLLKMHSWRFRTDLALPGRTVRNVNMVGRRHEKL